MTKIPNSDQGQSKLFSDNDCQDVTVMINFEKV